MIPQLIVNRLRQLFLASLVMALALSLLPVRAAQADTSTSDLAIQFISAPRQARACQTFQAKFRITNKGPDVVTGLFVSISIPDPLGVINLRGVPASLAPGESALVTAIIKVVAFVPGTPRRAWVGGGVSADPFPDTSVDPNWNNNNTERSLRLVGNRRAPACP